MKKIPLSGNGAKGRCILVDAEDHCLLSGWQWHDDGNGYAARSEKRKSIKMSRYIMNAPDNMVVDHINGNRLDNRKENLRVCTHQENMRNQTAQNNRLSKFKGVTFSRHAKRWKSYITVNKKQIFIGYFEHEIDAAIAYDAKALSIFRDFSKLNFPKEHGIYQSPLLD